MIKFKAWVIKKVDGKFLTLGEVVGNPNLTDPLSKAPEYFLTRQQARQANIGTPVKVEYKVSVRKVA